MIRSDAIYFAENVLEGSVIIITINMMMMMN